MIAAQCGKHVKRYAISSQFRARFLIDYSECGKWIIPITAQLQTDDYFTSHNYYSRSFSVYAISLNIFV